MKNRISSGNQIPNQTLSKGKNITLPLALFVLISYNLFFTICLPKRGLAEQEIKDFDYWASLCELLKNEKNDEEALAACNQALSINPKDAVTWTNRSTTLLKLNKYPEELVSAEQALRIKSNYSLALLNRCHALSELGRYEEAPALKLDPSNAIVLRALPDAIAQHNRDTIKQPLDEKQHKHWLDSLPKNIDARKEENI